jgi:antitoxin component of RelBE/YafQ-DinJ toxin-antitoxin module
MISVLKAKKNKKVYTKVITTRIPESIHDLFKKHCDENGFSVSEAIKLLIENELNSIQDVYKEDTKSIQNIYKSDDKKEVEPVVKKEEEKTLFQQREWVVLEDEGYTPPLPTLDDFYGKQAPEPPKNKPVDWSKLDEMDEIEQMILKSGQSL